MFNFYDDTIDGDFRRLSASASSSAQLNDSYESFTRMLASEATSACFCPLDSQINAGGVFEEQAESEFRGYLGDQFPAVKSYEELNVLRCGSQRQIPTRLRLDVKGFLATPDISKFEDLVKEVYNKLVSEQFCDTSFRRIFDVSVKSFVYSTDILVGEARCPTYAIDFDVEVKCRSACRDYDSLFYDGYDGFLGGFGGGRGPRRFLQTGAGNCYCEPGLPKRRPLEEEFFDALNQGIRNSNLRGLCGLEGYVNDNGFRLSSVLDMDIDPKFLHKDPPTVETWRNKIPVGGRLGGKLR
jgi:hypothetical protein